MRNNRKWLKRGVALAALAATLLVPQIASAAAGDVLVRVRGVGVLPDESASVTPLGGSVKIDNYYVPEVDFSYFFTDNISAELIAATTKHKATATAGGGIPLGSVWLLPPTLLAQYHFTPEKFISPYIGAGINYTLFYGTSNPPGLSVHYSQAVGPAVQFGIDAKLSPHWVFNVDVKKIWMETDVSINAGAIKAKVNIDPWLVGTGIGYRF